MEEEAGLDEAGVGALMHDLVAAAVVLPSDFDVTGVRDSKTLTAARRAKLAERIGASALVGIGRVTAAEIDAIGMGECRRLVHHRALDALPSRPKSIMVDGTLFAPYHDIPYRCEPRADAKYAHVAAASIVAKHTRDTELSTLCDTNPELAELYGWRQNKGYPTGAHRTAIAMHGRTPFHRHSFQLRSPCP